MDLHDKIASLCLHHFKKLPKTGKPKENEWTILSCIVQEDPSNDFKVIALGTGTKCIGKNKLSPNGDILNDSHAEITCRRAFLAYLYEEILNNLKNSELIEFDSSCSKILLKDNVKFHFFTTHVPCGDAAIFPKDDIEDFGTVINQQVGQKRPLDDFSHNQEITLKDKKRLKTDIYRTGAKCLDTDSNQDLKLDGRDYHKTGLVRTKPGRGVPTLSVSCSDKLAKWCHVGVQGALLNFVIPRPIYFDTFTIVENVPFCQKALERALFERLGNFYLNAPFRRTHLKVGRSKFSFNFAKSKEKSPCPSSIIWYFSKANETAAEIAVDGRKQGVTKKALAKGEGRLRICKLEMLNKFLRVLKTFNIMVNKEDLTYEDAKSLATNYQQVWNKMKNDGFKIWTTKSKELLQFKAQENLNLKK